MLGRLEHLNDMPVTTSPKREGTIKLDFGTIALQANDPDSRIYYKDIKIRILPD